MSGPVFDSSNQMTLLQAATTGDKDIIRRRRITLCSPTCRASTGPTR